jgi:hypothetical protein
MSSRNMSYLSPKCRMVEEPTKGGHGIFAAQPFLRGEIICIWGGVVVDNETLASLSKKAREHSLQVTEEYFMVSVGSDEPPNYFNHSCNPNAGLNGQIVLVAMRDISRGEEITFDYAMCDSSPYDEFVCLCRSDNCRGKITGNDWQNPGLWKRYNGYFSPYLQSRIHQKQKGGK